MSQDEENLFSQLAEDANIAAAIAEHEAACVQNLSHPCPICLFFSHIHELAHLSEALDAQKITSIAAEPHLFLDDAMVIIQFLTEATRYFLADQVAWFEEEDEEDEEYDDDDSE